MALNVYLRAAQSRRYWNALHVWGRIKFSFRKRLLSASETKASTKTDSRIILELIHITAAPLVLALLTALALLISEVYLPTYRLPWMPVALWHLDDHDSYATLLGTISGIGGVLIGLYYAGLTAVSSSAYAQAPSVLRSLLLRESVGRLYIRLLAFVTFISLCLLAFYSVGFSPVRLAIPLLIVFSGLTILSFVQLGQHAFYFLDPTRLANAIFVDLERWVERATVSSPFWADASFQAYSNQRARSSLKALATLTAMSAGQKQLRTVPIADLAISTIGFLYRYESGRRRIPTESAWYPSLNIHPDWYEAGDWKVEFAAQTGGPVQPSNIRQTDWVQTECLPLIFRAIETNLDENDQESTFRLLESLKSYLERLAELGEFEAAVDLITRISTTIGPRAWKAANIDSESQSWRLGLAEQISILPIKLLLAFIKWIDDGTCAKISHRLGKIRWNKPHRLY